jgi:hypothetical protein
MLHAFRATKLQARKWSVRKVFSIEMQVWKALLYPGHHKVVPSCWGLGMKIANTMSKSETPVE